MATSKDTGGQRQTTRRAEETEEDQAASADEVKERHEKLSVIQPPSHGPIVGALGLGGGAALAAPKFYTR